MATDVASASSDAVGCSLLSLVSPTTLTTEVPSRVPQLLAEIRAEFDRLTDEIGSLKSQRRNLRQTADIVSEPWGQENDCSTLNCQHASMHLMQGRFLNFEHSKPIELVDDVCTPHSKPQSQLDVETKLPSLLVQTRKGVSLTLQRDDVKDHSQLLQESTAGSLSDKDLVQQQSLRSFVEVEPVDGPPQPLRVVSTDIEEGVGVHHGGFDEVHADQQKMQQRSQTVMLEHHQPDLLLAETANRAVPPGRSRSSISEIKSPFRRQIKRILVYPWFDRIIGVVILADGFLLGVEAQHEMSPMLGDSLLQLMQSLSLIFRIIFLAELMLRFVGDGILQSLKDSWTRFDAILVLFSVLEGTIKYSAGTEVGPITIVRVFRLARLARTARLMIQFRTLWLLVSGLRASCMTVMWTFLLIASIGYIFAVLGMETIPLRDDMGSTKNTPILDERGAILTRVTNYQALSLNHFGSLSDAMLTLLQVLTLDSIAAIYKPLVMDAPTGMGYFNIIYFLLFIFFVSISLMNLVTAVMVEGSLQQANADKESLRAHEEQRKRLLMPKLRDMFKRLDVDGNGAVSMQEITLGPRWITSELKNLTHTEDLSEIFSLLDDDDSGYVQIDEFLDGIFKASSGDVLAKLQLARLVRQCGQMKAAVCREQDQQAGGMQVDTKKVAIP
eukprot:TRINITY_DN25280_c1_g1_i1.p1 TRINITY_DN25280_c1_g1~~TRINITY_DN25280_c1_g1_i1.p1  ORF type:complete len:701 (+),score=105.19 TRINITY_DN25280_c1_g1_i1:97-2103(+)